MVSEIKDFFDDLNLERLRIRRPSKFMFLCGGVISKSTGARAENLRDYLCRVRPLKLNHPVVLAEEAVELYRKTHYHDLISFEEDLARIAAVVLVIVESPGSFAELGAFASNDTIRKSLKVVIQEEYESTESFVRYGPVERVSKARRSDLGVYPWRTRGGKLVVSSTSAHYYHIKKFFKSHLEGTPNSVSYSSLSDARLFYIIYWVTFVCLAISPARLFNYVRLIDPDIKHDDFRNKLFCMQLANWIGREPYSGTDYFFARFDTDPFEYSFRTEAKDTRTVSRKQQIFTEHNRIEKIPSHVRKVAGRAREPKP